MKLPFSLSSAWRFYVSLVVIGVIAGLVGTVLTFILHHVQHFAFGYGASGAEMSFREGVSQSAPERRWLVLTLCGGVVGAGWFALHKFGVPLRSIKQALAAPQQGLPFGKTLCHVLLQIVTVGLGSPLGREVAPREMSVAFASLWLKPAKLSADEAKVLLACASGAGLTAVYNVPLAATVFILETMLLSWSARMLTAAFVSVGVATGVARFFLGDLVQYAHLPRVEITASLLIFSALAGGLIGWLVPLFRATTQRVPFLPRTHRAMPWLAVLLFSVIGLVAVYQPEILGNGKAGNQLTFSALIGWHESLQLMGLKWLVILLALAAGAYGGLITPSMMLGSTFAYTLASLWNLAFPSVSLEGAALVGACVFLGSMQKMPLTAVIFLLELTRSNAEMLMPFCVATAATLASERLYQRLQAQA